MFAVQLHSKVITTFCLRIWKKHKDVSTYSYFIDDGIERRRLVSWSWISRKSHMVSYKQRNIQHSAFKWKLYVNQNRRLKTRPEKMLLLLPWTMARWHNRNMLYGPKWGSLSLREHNSHLITSHEYVYRCVCILWTRLCFAISKCDSVTIAFRLCIFKWRFVLVFRT